jgi:mycothiol synthase
MIVMTNAQSIPGLHFRHFQGVSDYAQMAAALTASEMADNLERNASADDIAIAYQRLKNCDPFKDIIIAEVSGKIVGYARGWWESDINSGHIYHHNGFLIPEWRRKKIGHALLLWMESHLSECANSQHASTRCFQVNVTQFQEGTAIMLQRAGYQPIRYFYEMVRPTLNDVVEFTLPDGLEIRPVTPEHYEAIWKSVVDETGKEEWGYTEPTENDYQEWLTSPHFQPHLWQVAWDIATNQIVGHVLTFIDEGENKQLYRKRGYTEGIGVDRKWQRRGIARAMISRSLQAQKAAGMTESALVADSESTSNVVGLYEICGFQIVKRDTIYRKYF